MSQIPESLLASNRNLPLTRWLSAVIVPVLVAAFVILYLFPERTGELFAWPIKPTMTALMLGGTYLGGAYFFTRSALDKRWVNVKLGLLPVSVFAGTLGVATLMHWDKFTHGSLAFRLWAILYLSLPAVIPLVWLLNRRQDPGPKGMVSLPVGLRLAFGVLGGVLSVAAIMLFALPEVMIPLWPWSLTPLTARVMAALFALSGFTGLGVAIDGRRTSARYVLQAQIVAIVLILLGLGLASSEIEWAVPGTWGLVAGLVVEGGLAVVVLFYGGGTDAT